MLLITLTTDFGSSSEYSGSLKGAILRAAPGAKIVDITHNVKPFSVINGAFVLASAAPQFPRAVHLCVIDPGVGSERKLLALKTRYGHWLLGPDNGVLIDASERLGGIKEAYFLIPKHFVSQRISPTFHGRDILAPAAAIISYTDDASEIGAPLEIEELTGSPLTCEFSDSQVTSIVADIDRFGSLRVPVLYREIESRFELKETVEIILSERNASYRAKIAKFFAEVEKGELLIYEDSSGYTGISANLFSANRILNAEIGGKIILRF